MRARVRAQECVAVTTLPPVAAQGSVAVQHAHRPMTWPIGKGPNMRLSMAASGCRSSLSASTQQWPCAAQAGGMHDA
jgi:hypothetical protein